MYIYSPTFIPLFSLNSLKIYSWECAPFNEERDFSPFGNMVAIDSFPDKVGHAG